ncbi:cytochrome d ubiquinol oxidase subunit II [uncultured Alistipes sp.]|uniref:cytochrome d ubiquinol oxidase subunit II n=1 Tax=uncultured Alistipes sp. TaxID=538949 RepID=UPI0025E41AC2|nr:cytochrome d ubiquinol oxidase subunit II [uncultured Alistipes sp.]
MDTLILLQHYWWLIISLLGALLVFLLFVQGGQGLLYDIGKTEEERNMLVNSLGRKWEFTFTTLVTFGGAFFASFPLFYSTSFGGAYYVWMAILLSFVIQPVAYQFRRKAGNVFGEKTFNVFLIINGIAGPLLLGTAVGTLFTGANFTVDRLNLANGAGCGSATVISQWTTPWHGLEALGDLRNVALGLAVMFLAMTLACQYFMNNIDDKTIHERARKRMAVFAVPFLVFFLTFFVWLLFSDGRAVDTAGRISIEPYKYLHNLLAMPYVAAVLLIGVGAVLWSIFLGWRGRRNAIWFGGAGTVLTVLALLLCAGWNDTAYYPSLADMQSSLTIYNSSSSLFTLKAMSIVSLMIPFVAAYIWYAWRAMNRKSITREEIRGDDHQY